MRQADFIQDMNDVRLRETVKTLVFALFPVLGFALGFDFVPAVAGTIVGVIQFALILGLVFGRQRVVVKSGATELVVERSVLGIRWGRRRIAFAKVKKLRLGWLQVRLGKWPGRRPNLPAVRLELRDLSLVPVAAARTITETEALAADLARRLNCPVVGARLLARASSGPKADM